MSYSSNLTNGAALLLAAVKELEAAARKMHEEAVRVTTVQKLAAEKAASQRAAEAVSDEDRELLALFKFNDPKHDSGVAYADLSDEDQATVTIFIMEAAKHLQEAMTKVSFKTAVILAKAYIVNQIEEEGGIYDDESTISDDPLAFMHALRASIRNRFVSNAGTSSS